MLDISHLSVITFVTIFFYFICLSLFFFFLMSISFAAELLSLIISNLFLLLFSFALGNRSRKNNAIIYVKEGSTYVLS